LKLFLSHFISSGDILLVHGPTMVVPESLNLLREELD